MTATPAGQGRGGGETPLGTGGLSPAAPTGRAADQGSGRSRSSASTRGRSRLVWTKRRITTGSVCGS